MVFGQLVKVEISISRVDLGRWKLVIRVLIIWNGWFGQMKMLVLLLKGFSLLLCVVFFSECMLVVLMVIIWLLWVWQMEIVFIMFWLIFSYLWCIIWFLICLICIGWKVLVLICRVMKVVFIFFVWIVLSSVLLKCRLVVGVVIVLVCWVQMVWQCLWLVVLFGWLIQGGNGMCLICFSKGSMGLVNVSLNRVLWCCSIFVLLLFLMRICVLGLGVLLVCMWVSIWCWLSMCLIRIFSLLLDFFWLNRCVGIIWVLLNIIRLFGCRQFRRLVNCLWVRVFVGLFSVNRWFVWCLGRG